MNNPTRRARTVTLLADGSSDQHALVPLIALVLDQHSPAPYRLSCPDPLPPSRGLAARISDAIGRFPCDVLLVHRDAEGEPYARREQEIGEAVDEAGITVRHVKVVPVRMTEAWLLADERAIRLAVGNPAGTAPLELPSVRDLEGVGAKEVLLRAIVAASELGAQRRRRLNPVQYRHRVAEAITDLRGVRQLASFRRFEDALAQAAAGWSDAAV